MKGWLCVEGIVKGEHIQLTVYERFNRTRGELRYAWTYRVGQTLDVGRGGARDVGIRGGRYDVLKVHANGKVELADGRRKIRFDPHRLSPTEPRDRLQLSEKKDLHLRDGDRTRWTATHTARRILNAAPAPAIGTNPPGLPPT